MTTNDKGPNASLNLRVDADVINRRDLQASIDRITERASTQADCFENAKDLISAAITALCTTEPLEPCQASALANLLSLADDYISVAYSRYLLEWGRE